MSDLEAPHRRFGKWFQAGKRIHPASGARARRPAWWDDARRYHSLIGEGSAQPVSVFDATDCDETADESPGTLRLQLEPRFRYSPRMRVLDAGGREEGVIRPEGLVPGVRYAMRRDDGLAWTLSVRSIVRNRHALNLAGGDSWAFRTPFFGVRLTGSVLDAPRLIGVAGPGMWAWQMQIEAGRDTIDLLAAVAFLHRQWSHM